MEQRDQGAEDRQAGDEGLGAVDRIEHPDVVGIGAHRAMLLAEHAVLGHVLGEQVAHRGLGLAVGDGHRTASLLSSIVTWVRK